MIRAVWLQGSSSSFGDGTEGPLSGFF